MPPYRMFSQQGWRRSGIVNIVLVSALGCILLVILITCIIQTEAPFKNAAIFYEGQCDTTPRINLALHLVINIISSAVLASSNFFMQVLNAPSREEIDKAHLYLTTLEIGIPSVKNLRFVSTFKRCLWLLFFLTSFPIHLLFNSTVFETNYMGGDWQLTIATEAFTRGAPFLAPGASLAPAGAPGPGFIYDSKFEQYRFTNGSWSVGMYGDSVELTQYWAASSTARQTLNYTAEAAASWIVLDPHSCLTEYRLCTPRKQYSDVVVVVKSGASDANGWKRSEVFDFDVTTNLSSIWDPYIPPDAVNPLWFSAHCTINIPRGEGGFQQKSCQHTCASALGLKDYTIPTSTTAPSGSNWTFSFHPNQPYLPAEEIKQLGFNEALGNLAVDYCLAKPLAHPCKLGFSKELFLVTTICVLLKAIQAVIVVWKLSNSSLITPGDAIESFIAKPDYRTVGFGTLDIVDSRRLEYGKRKPWVAADPDREYSAMIQPRPWDPRGKRLWHIIPRVVWFRTYLVLVSGMTILVTFMVIAAIYGGGIL